MRTVYFTTPIYFVNAEPPSATSTRPCWRIRSPAYHRMMGDDAYFLTDRRATVRRSAEAAAKQGVEMQALVDRVSGVFSDHLEADRDLQRRLQSATERATRRTSRRCCRR